MELINKLNQAWNDIENAMQEKDFAIAQLEAAKLAHNSAWNELAECAYKLGLATHNLEMKQYKLKQIEENG